MTTTYAAKYILLYIFLYMISSWLCLLCQASKLNMEMKQNQYEYPLWLFCPAHVSASSQSEPSTRVIVYYLFINNLIIPL